mmetsp:Transcript_28264/g.76329  ORF Transcript_28264/g.76329 Transcript_28264/m.76329 type:complete len:276 (+) Transcript_28264:2700-3527(+)
MACPRVWLVPSTLAWLRNSTMFKHPAAAGPPSLLFPPPPASSSIRASQPRTTAWQWLMPCASSLGTRRSHAGLRRWKGERGSRRMVARSLQMGLMCSWCTCATNLCCASTSSCCCWFGLLLVQEELPERQPCCSSLRRVFTSASNSAVTSQAASRGRQMIGSLRTADGGVEQGAPFSKDAAVDAPPPACHPANLSWMCPVPISRGSTRTLMLCVPAGCMMGNCTSSTGQPSASSSSTTPSSLNCCCCMPVVAPGPWGTEMTRLHGTPCCTTGGHR